MDSSIQSFAWRGLLVVLFGAFWISATNVSAPLVYRDGGNAQTLLILRNVGFLLICGLWLKSQGRFRWLDRRGQLGCIGAGTAYTVGSGSLLFSFAYLPAGLAVLIFYLFPLLTTLMEDGLERRWPSLGRIVCLAVALGGLVLALEVHNFTADPIGVAFATLAGIGVAVSFVVSGRALAGVDSAVMTFHMAITSLVLAVILAAATSGVALPAGNWVGWAALAVAVFGFAAAFFAMFRGVHLIGATPAAMVMNMEPVFTIALAVLLLSESLSGRKLIGGAAVILAVTASQILSARAAPRR